MIDSSHPDICDAPKDESEEGIKERRHKREQVGEERDDFGDDEGAQPGDCENANPDSPALDGMFGKMAFVALEDPEDDEATRDGSVKNAEENERWDHEREGDIDVEFPSKRPKGWSRHVLISGESVDDCSDQAENDDFGDRHSPKSFRKVLGIFHLGHEGRDGDLTNKRVGDVEEGVESSDECDAFDGYGGDRWGSSMKTCGGDYGGRIWVVTEGVIFDSRKDGGEHDRDEGEDCRCGGQPR